MNDLLNLVWYIEKLKNEIFDVMFCVTERTGYKTDGVLLTTKKSRKTVIINVEIFSF